MILEFLAPMIALVLLLIGMEIAVAVTGAIRSHDYWKFKDRSRERLQRQLALPSADGSPADNRRTALDRFVGPVYDEAIGAQTRYYQAVVRSAACLMVAFVGLVLGVVIDRGSILDAWPEAKHLVEHVLAWLDAMAIVLLLALFLFARYASRHWIGRRARAELLRQYQFLDVVFPSAGIAPEPDAVKSRFKAQADEVEARVEEGSTTDITSRIERFWSERRSSIAERALTDSDLSGDAMAVYLDRRARRQLLWFTDAGARLEYIAERRKLVLVTLYCMAAGLALAKLAFAVCGHAPAHFLPLLLIVTGVSAVMTAYYINQNARSLIHRYNTQQRRITAWLRSILDRSNLAELQSMTAAMKTELRAEILEFEDLMIEELIDWAHITGHDAMELAP